MIGPAGELLLAEDVILHFDAARTVWLRAVIESSAAASKRLRSQGRVIGEVLDGSAGEHMLPD